MRHLWLLFLSIFAVSCKPCVPEKVFVNVPIPCVYLELPPKPRLPIQDYQPTWTKDQLLEAYARSTLMLEQWRTECAALVEAHNRNQQKPRAPTDGMK